MDCVIYEPRFDAKLDHSCFLLIFTSIMTARHGLSRNVESFPSLRGQNQRTVMVTVLMPIPEKGSYIERAIRSVRSQTLQHLELVIADDKPDDLLGVWEETETVQPVFAYLTACGFFLWIRMIS
jgi:hypothetical protein